MATQALYAVTGIVLARLLSHEDFGLVGAIMVFQAFASLFVDSGFSSALIQRKAPTRLDYSTVLWFNLLMSAGLYAILFVCAPWIADLFQGDRRLVPLSRVMFLAFMVNATAIVQTNILMKKMDVRMIAASNSAGLTAGAVVGIYLALAGYGAWAIVWQTITVAGVKSALLWLTGRWRPLWRFSWQSLRSFFRVGSGVMVSSLLNTIFLNIYAFFIGNRAGLVSLGYYTQADKWSKMGVTSISQTLTSSFLPALSRVQDDAKRFASAVSKMNRFTAYVALPAMGGLAVMAAPIFHLLFGTKWDAAIGLFQILLVRGVFVIMTGLYNNYILALGHAKTLVWTEAVRDGVAIAAIVVTLPWIALETPECVTAGIKIFLWGQLIAAALTWTMTLVVAARLSRIPWGRFLVDLLPYAAQTLLVAVLVYPFSLVLAHPATILAAQCLVGGAIYIGLNAALHSQVQRDALEFIRGKRAGG